MSKQMKLSTAQLDVLRSARPDGRVYGGRPTIAALMRHEMVENPRYNYGGGGTSWAYITDLGRAAATDGDS